MVSENLLGFAAQQYCFDQSTLRFISSTTNQVYEFHKDGAAYILRFAERDLEWLHQTKAEMDWLYYLANHKVNVSLPLTTERGELAILTPDNGRNYIISAFKMAKGSFWDKQNPLKWNDRIFFQWGKTMGDMHNLTKDYHPSNKTNLRGSFNHYWGENIKAYPSVYKIALDVVDEMESLPVDRDSYGLIHYDFHPWNFFIDGDEIYVFDFDDCLYGWYALDIGVALYHGLWWGRKDYAEPIPNDFTQRIIVNFIRGYLSSNHLSNYWLAKVPLFMRFRQICKFSWFFKPEHLDEHQKERIFNIQNNILFTDCVIDKSLFRGTE